MGRLTDTIIRKAKPSDKDYDLPDGLGLYAQIRATGNKVFIIRFYINGKAGRYTVGEYPRVSLANARIKLQEIKQLAKQGINPNQLKKEGKREKERAIFNNFESIAEQWLKEEIEPKSPRYYARMARTARNILIPEFGSLPLTSIDSAMIYAVMKRIADRGTTDAANEVKRCVGAIIRYAIRTAKVKNYQDPTVILKGAVAHESKNGSRALEKQEIKALFDKLKTNRSTLLRLGISLLAYTAVRTVEIRRGEWAEIDWEKKEWHIPAHKMKNGLDHIVPLSTQALSLFRELYELTGKYRYGTHFLPNRVDPSKPLSEGTFNQGLKNMGFDISCHDWRTTFKTYTSEMDVPDYLTERQLSHVEKKLQRTYNKALYLNQRHEVMQLWGDTLDSLIND